ncbi:MAG TPA: sigma-70 family RNA polymerase sigma factor [Polyangiaceae bacterium]
MSPVAPLTPAELMVHPHNTRVIRRTLLENSTPERDLDDATQDVYVKLLEAFARGDAPADLGEMSAFSTTVAKRHAIDALRKKEADARDLAEPCEASKYYPLRPLYEQRDPVEAGRQLEALAQLFREGRMPEHGVDILEGVASGCSYAEIGEPLKLTAACVRARMRQMRKVYRRRMVKLGLWPDMPPLRVVAVNSGAIGRLRRVA